MRAIGVNVIHKDTEEEALQFLYADKDHVVIFGPQTDKENVIPLTGQDILSYMEKYNAKLENLSHLMETATDFYEWQQMHQEFLSIKNIVCPALLEITNNWRYHYNDLQFAAKDYMYLLILLSKTMPKSMSIEEIFEFAYSQTLEKAAVLNGVIIQYIPEAGSFTYPKIVDADNHEYFFDYNTPFFQQEISKLIERLSLHPLKKEPPSQEHTPDEYEL